MAFDGVLKFGTAIDQSGFKSGLSGLGNLAKTTGTAVAGAFMGAAAAGTAAVTAIGKEALDAYADFEQLAGGVETLFGDAADVVMENASKAFQTAGMSANQYMETATTSAAAMVNSLAGDTQKAAELTDMAVTDMSDNANKMGTAMENIQNAYAGFAKGNFTMLDNLKLGYGGTKTEMERLLAKAQELTGVQYDISSYADIVQAIHAIQENMGITGTTAKEAADTISGSTASMKAAWDNLLVGIADDSQDFDKLAQDFVSSVETAAGNILPRIETIGGGVVKLIGALGDDAVRLLTDALSYAPELAGIGVQLIGALLEGLTDHLPELLDSGKTMLMTLANGAVNSSWVVLDAVNAVTAGLADAVADEKLMKRLERTGRTLLANLARGLETNLPVLLETGTELLQWLLDAFLTPENLAGALAFGGTLLSMLADSLSENLPLLLEAGISILEMLGGVLIENLPLLVDCANTIIQSLVKALSDPEMLTALLGAGLAILESLLQIIGDNIGLLITAAIQIVETLGVWIADHAVELATTAIELVTVIVSAILEHANELNEAAFAIIRAVVDNLTEPEQMEKLMHAAGELIREIFKGLGTYGTELGEFTFDLFEALGNALGEIDWAQLGKAIVEGICSGLLGTDFDLNSYLSDFGNNWVSGIKDVFGIHSPSRLMRDQVGKYLALGIGEGFEENLPDVGRGALDAFEDFPALPEIELGLAVSEPPPPPDPGEIPDPDGEPDPITVQYDAEDLPLPDPNPIEIPVGFDLGDLPDGMDSLRVSIDSEALQMLRELRGSASPDAVQAIRDAMPDLAALAAAPVPGDAAAYIMNNYSSTSYITNSENHAAPEPAAPGGDLIIPVSIGSQQLDTIVIKAAQIANARSGGVTI